MRTLNKVVGNTITATILPAKKLTEKQQAKHDARFRKNRNEKNYTNTLLVLDGKQEELVRANIYCNRNGFVSCCLWIHGKDYRQGSGSASSNSGGYHKASHCLQEAITDCNIKLSQYIGGAGERAMEDALMAIARAMDPKGKHKLIRTNG